MYTINGKLKNHGIVRAVYSGQNTASSLVSVVSFVTNLFNSTAANVFCFYAVGLLVHNDDIQLAWRNDCESL